MVMPPPPGAHFVVRQTRLPPADIAAAMRAYMAANAAGMLAAMLLTPSLLALLGPAKVITAAGLLLAATAATGLARFAQWREPLPA